MNVQEIDTPALLIDMDAMERNISRVADFLREKQCKVRLHTKFC